jgi:hypothetical protein
MRQDLVAAGAPPAVADQVIKLYQVCFHDRSTAKDPTITPPSCATAAGYRPTPQQLGVTPQQMAVVGPRLGAAAARIFSRYGTEAVRTNFTDTIQESLIYNVVAFALAFLLVFLLPRHLRQQGRPPAMAPAEAPPEAAAVAH